MTNLKVLVRRYHDLSEGVPTEALAQISTLKSVHGAPISGKRYVEGLVEVQARGKEMIVVLDRCAQEPSHIVNLDAVFSNQKYYRVNDRIAKIYIWQILNAVHAIHSCMYVHRNINMKNIITVQHNMPGSINIILTNFEKSA